MWGSIGLLICVLAAKTSFDFLFRRKTEAALARGKLEANSYFSFMTPKVGCYRFTKSIRGEVIEAYLVSSSETSERTYLIDLLGWRQRHDLLGVLRTLTNSGPTISQHAICSVVAIEKSLPFAQRDFAHEYYREYVQKVTQLAKRNEMGIYNAAEMVASQLQVPK